ncbi:MAG: hypothetical protein LBI79_08010 [Nitrososphaerota archaeon]|nr:hypothetical protein [Nitrososphaerota archaeon]
MVNIVEEWEILETYTGEKLGFYQILDTDGKIEIRVTTGKIGYKKDYDQATDPELTHILAFCKRRQFIQIHKTIQDNNFFK